MEPRNLIFSAVMVISAMVLTYCWSTRFGSSDLTIILSSIILVASLSALILNIDNRIKKMEEQIESKERSLRISIQGVEETNKKFNRITHNHSAYSSIIGKLKYKDMFGISDHQAAAYVIGRRLLGFVEKIPKELKKLIPYDLFIVFYRFF